MLPESVLDREAQRHVKMFGHAPRQQIAPIIKSIVLATSVPIIQVAIMRLLIVQVNRNSVTTGIAVRITAGAALRRAVRLATVIASPKNREVKNVPIIYAVQRTAVIVVPETPRYVTAVAVAKVAVMTQNVVMQVKAIIATKQREVVRMYFGAVGTVIPAVQHIIPVHRIV